MLRVATTIGALCFATAAAAQECAEIADDSERLTCYDAKFPPVAAAAEPATPEPIRSNWSMHRENSAIDDSTSVFLTIRSNEIAQCGFQKQPAQLTVRCVENTTAMIISTSCHLTSGYSDYGNVTMRIDDEAAFTREFIDSTNNNALGLWNGGSSIPVIRRLMEGERLVTRFTPFGDNPVELTFDIAGLGDVINPLREACSW